ncbi:MAG: tRNA lysidine(34) synthetase TilS [Planctomycetaceae bacterium]|nr:tRNA lysidine(34) synthetase TilS [Planctomycetaceae bacterium]
MSQTLPVIHWLEHGILVAVSGGADSMSLLHFLAQYESHPKRLAAAHVNHCLRGEESDADADFVRHSVAGYGLQYFEHRIAPEEWNTNKYGSLEAAARKIRYDFLTRTAEHIGFRYVATAHSADDQTETVLHRMIRGTGISGLAGITKMRQLNPAVTLIRPLLNIRRYDIIAYLEKLGKPFRTDSTNSKNHFTRNRIRNLLLPILRKEFNPKVDDAIERFAYLAAENAEVLDELIDEIFEKAILQQTPNEIILDSSKLQSYQISTLREFFVRLWKRKGWSMRHLGFEQWELFVAFFCSATGRYEMRGSVIAEHNGKHFILRRVAANSEGR